MQESKPSYKIYSRNRIKIFKSKNYNRNYRKKDIKFFYMFCIIVIVSITYIIIYKSIDPIFETICSDKAQAIATKITNQESTKVMVNYSYNEMFTIEKDENR